MSSDTENYGNFTKLQVIIYPPSPWELVANGDDPFPLARPIFRGELLVLGRVIVEVDVFSLCTWQFSDSSYLSLTDISSSCRVGSF